MTIAATGQAVSPEPVVPPVNDRANKIEARFDRQQDRIDQGVESGQLTDKEYTQLQNHLDRVEASYDKDMSANGGHLTSAEAKSLNARLDSNSEQIYFDKHNLARQPGAPPPGSGPSGISGSPEPVVPPVTSRSGQIQNRFERQQDRIDQGVESGQLTDKEYTHLENRLHDIERSYRHDMAANGGHLTKAEAHDLNARLDSNSEQIYFDKHNLARQPGAPQA